MPSDFDDFLQNEDNKSFLNLFIATRAETIDLDSEVGCVVYIKANIVIDCKDRKACHMHTDDNLTLEEADNRIIMPYIKLWNDHIRILCDFGTGVNRKATSINLIYERFGEALCLALPFYHVFSGCDSTPYFFNYTKSQLYAIWMSCPIHVEVSWVFQLLS